MIEPYITRPHQVGNGIQKIYKFENGYGASVVRFTVMGMTCSYTNGNEWELAIIKWNEDEKDFDLCYDTGITDDVLGHLTDDEIEDILIKIKKLKCHYKKK